MGIEGRRLLGLIFFSAVKLPPARYLDTSDGTLPDARRFTTLFRETQSGEGKGIPTTSRRY